MRQFNVILPEFPLSTGMALFFQEIPFRDKLYGYSDLVLDTTGAMLTYKFAFPEEAVAELASHTGPALKRTFERGESTLVLSPREAELLKRVYMVSPGPVIGELVHGPVNTLLRTYSAGESALVLSSLLTVNRPLQKHAFLRHELVLDGAAAGHLALYGGWDWLADLLSGAAETVRVFVPPRPTAMELKNTDLTPVIRTPRLLHELGELTFDGLTRAPMRDFYYKERS